MNVTLENLTPDDIPPEILLYDSVISQLGVGKAGKLGGLSLRFEKDSYNEKTAIKEQFSKVPLITLRALYLEEELPSMAYLYIISASGGILQGDRYRIDIILKNDAKVHLTTQSATRIYKMEKNFATQIINVTVDDGCYFEFIPEQIIPFRGARFYQKVNLNVHENATMIYSEIIVPGRVESGESFEYDICYLKTIAKNQKGVLQFTDIAILEPKKREARSLGILGKFAAVGTVYILIPARYITDLNEEISSRISNFSNIIGGTSILPNNSGVVVRALGNVASDLKELNFEIAKLVRKKILNAPFSEIRKC